MSFVNQLKCELKRINSEQNLIKKNHKLVLDYHKFTVVRDYLFQDEFNERCFILVCFAKV